LRHKGRYQCNINHKNSHFLNVHPSAQTSDNSEEQESIKNVAYFESENDHEDQREKYDPPFEMTSSYSTIKSFVESVTVSTFLPNSIDTIPNFDDEKSHENFEEETTYEDSSDSFPYTSTIPSFTNPIQSTTHATTHSTTSEVVLNTHLEKHHFKGSQNEK
jgi:hypothetical protein